MIVFSSLYHSDSLTIKQVQINRNDHKGKVCVEKNIPEEEAVERLLEFIRTDREENQQ